MTSTERPADMIYKIFVQYADDVYPHEIVRSSKPVRELSKAIRLAESFASAMQDVHLGDFRLEVYSCFERASVWVKRYYAGAA